VGSVEPHRFKETFLVQIKKKQKKKVIKLKNDKKRNTAFVVAM
jgi:hypothetical protein